jgi:hypothetical protein
MSGLLPLLLSIAYREASLTSYLVLALSGLSRIALYA